MTQATPAEYPETQASTQTRKTKVNGQPQPGRVISDPNEVAQLVMMRITKELKGSTHAAFSYPI